MHRKLCPPGDLLVRDSIRDVTGKFCTSGNERRTGTKFVGQMSLQCVVIIQPNFYGSDNRCTYDAIVEACGR